MPASLILRDLSTHTHDQNRWRERQVQRRSQTSPSHGSTQGLSSGYPPHQLAMGMITASKLFASMAQGDKRWKRDASEVVDANNMKH